MSPQRRDPLANAVKPLLSVLSCLRSHMTLNFAPKTYARPTMGVLSFLVTSGLVVRPADTLRVSSTLIRTAPSPGWVSVGQRHCVGSRTTIERECTLMDAARTGTMGRWRKRGIEVAMSSTASETEVATTSNEGTPSYEMEFRELGTSGLVVSKAGIGCMMFGQQMEEDAAHSVLDAAFDKHGINWLDTSENYPYPSALEFYGQADRVVGSWLAGRDRSKVIVSTKVAGSSGRYNWQRKDGTPTRLTRDQIMESVEGSLERLGTDYIDLLHLGDWPDRYVDDYGQYFYTRSLEKEQEVDFEEQLMAVQELMEQGVVRHVGVSNETPYGISRFTEHAEWDDLPKIACNQVPYNLLTRLRVEMSLVETCGPKQCNVSMVATSTLGGGALTGKYLDEPSIYDRDLSLRFNAFPGFQARFNMKRSREVMRKFIKIADRYDMTITELALAWVYNKPFITAILLGATSPEQLDENIPALRKPLNEDLVMEMNELFSTHREPALGPAEFEIPRTYDKNFELNLGPYNLM